MPQPHESAAPQSPPSDRTPKTPPPEGRDLTAAPNNVLGGRAPGLATTGAPSDRSLTPLIEREAGGRTVPATWCVVVCEQGCSETWTVDTADFEPRLTAYDVERLLTPLLIAHEVGHDRW